MKKIYMLMVALLFGGGVFAQLSIHQEINLVDPSLMPAPSHNSGETRANEHLWLEYDTADAINFGAQQSHTIQWIMNKRYTFAQNPHTYQYIIVRFDSLYDVNNQAGFDPSLVNTIQVDSIYGFLGHQNNSGTPDTLIMKIIDLDASHYPGTNVLWADTSYTSTSLSPANNWKAPVRLLWTPNYSNTMKNFAIEVDFYGSTSDTCAFLAGFNNLGSSGALCPFRANLSNFYPNSFVAWTDYSSIGYPLLPDVNGLDITQDCNQNGMFDDGIDGYNFIQDIVFGAYITINSNVAVEELKNTGITLSQNFPNPLHNNTVIKYELANNAKDVTLSVYDIVGSKVMEVKEGNRSHGKYSIQLDGNKLSKGMYSYTLRADGSQLTKRMIVE